MTPRLSSALEGAKGWATEYPHVPLGASALLLSLGSGVVIQHPTFGIPLIILAGIFGWFGVRRRDARERSRVTLQDLLSSREGEIAVVQSALIDMQLTCRSTVQAGLASLAVWARLGSNERLSLYELSAEGWLRRGRYSTNLDYMRGGRSMLPTGQGVIEKAHKFGEFSAVILSQFEDDPEGYFREQKSLLVNKGTISKTTMRSHNYAAFAFGTDDARDRPYVLIFESTDPNGLDADDLRSLVHDECRYWIATILHLAEQVRASAKGQ